jgi:hypothetical protein
MDNWKENRKPRVAYLTADNSFGRSIVIKQMDDYLTKLGFDLVGAQYMPLVPASPPTTQLMWLKTEKVDLALGCMVNPGSQPTIKEANRLGMGPDLDYKITFGFAGPSHLADFAPDMGPQGNGVIVGGSFPTLDDLSVEGIRFCNELISKYRSGTKNMHIMYVAGVLEAMIQTEALRLALEKVPFEELTPKEVLESGFYQIKGLETGGLSSTPITYGPGDVEGVDKVRLDIADNGKVKYLGSYSCRHIINPFDIGGY